MAVEQVLPRRLVRWTTAEPDWDQVYTEELPRVFNFFRYRFGHTADAEDLTARTFEKAWRSRATARTSPALPPGCLPSPATSPSITRGRASRTCRSMPLPRCRQPHARR